MTLFIACYTTDRAKLYFLIKDPNPNTKNEVIYSQLNPDTKKALDEARYIGYKQVPAATFDHIVFVWYD